MTSQNKPVILVVISSYLPGERAGGPVRTIANMVDWLGNDFDFRILTSDRDIGDTVPYSGLANKHWHRIGKAEVRYLSPEEMSLWQLNRLLLSLTYDVLYINAVFATISLKILLLHRLKLLPHKPIIVAPRGQWRPEALELKARKKKTFMALAKLGGLYSNLKWHASNEDEKLDIERVVGVINACHLDVSANLPISPAATTISAVKRVKSEGAARIVFLARLVHNKGLDVLMQHLAHVKGHVQLDIYGALEDSIYWKECEAQIHHLPENICVFYRGVAPFNQVISILSQYHLYVLPTLSENFGHGIIEALVAGCPVLISDRTPWKDIPTGGAGWVLPLENPMAWQSAIQKMLDMDQSRFDAMSANAHHYGRSYCTHSQPADNLREYFTRVVITP